MVLGCEGKFQGVGIQVYCFWAIAGCCSSRENLRERKAALSKWSLLHFQMYVWEHKPLVDKFLAEIFSVFPVPRKNTALPPSLCDAHTMSHCCKKQWQSLVMRFSSLVLILGAGKACMQFYDHLHSLNWNPKGANQWGANLVCLAHPPVLNNLVYLFLLENLIVPSLPLFKCCMLHALPFHIDQDVIKQWKSASATKTFAFCGVKSVAL